MIKRNEKQSRSGKSTSVSKRFAISALIIACILVLAGGFFFAANQHFSSMDYGMKNSRLRKQVDQLEAEKRRLILAREVSLSPTEIKKAAKKAGLFDPVPPTVIAQSAEPVRTSSEQSKKEAMPLVVKTASVSAIQPLSEAKYRVSDKTGREIKKTLSTE